MAGCLRSETVTRYPPEWYAPGMAEPGRQDVTLHTLHEALTAGFGDLKATLVAGCTDLGVESNLRHRRWPHLVSVEAIDASAEARMRATIAASNMEAVPLERAPRVAIYTPPNAEIWDDAVTMALEYAGIRYETIWDPEVLSGKLSEYEWVHLHHEDFTGQYSKFFLTYGGTEWLQDEVDRNEEMAASVGARDVPDLKKRVAAAMRAGAGLVYLAVPASLQPVVAGRVPEVVTLGLSEVNGEVDVEFALAAILARQPTAMLVGPGLRETKGDSASVHAFPVDVTDARAVSAVVRQIESELGPVDRVMNAAAIMTPAVAAYDTTSSGRTAYSCVSTTRPSAAAAKPPARLTAVVVLPEPFTPTTMMTAGFVFQLGTEEASSLKRSSSCRAAESSSERVRPWSPTTRCNASSISPVVSIPRSAWIKSASRSSQVSWVISVAPNNVAMRPKVVLLVLASPLRHFAKRSAMTGDYIMWYCVLYSFFDCGQVHCLIFENKGKKGIQYVRTHSCH